VSASRITAWRLDQVEGIEEHIGVMAPVPDPIKGGNAIIAACDCLPIDDAGA